MNGRQIAIFLAGLQLLLWGTLGSIDELSYPNSMKNKN
jgi:hypothetical protein